MQAHKSRVSCSLHENADASQNTTEEREKAEAENEREENTH